MYEQWQTALGREEGKGGGGAGGKAGKGEGNDAGKGGGACVSKKVNLSEASKQDAASSVAAGKTPSLSAPGSVGVACSAPSSSSSGSGLGAGGEKKRKAPHSENAGGAGGGGQAAKKANVSSSSVPKLSAPKTKGNDLLGGLFGGGAKAKSAPPSIDTSSISIEDGVENSPRIGKQPSPKEKASKDGVSPAGSSGGRTPISSKPLTLPGSSRQTADQGGTLSGLKKEKKRLSWAPEDKLYNYHIFSPHPDEEREQVAAANAGVAGMEAGIGAGVFGGDLHPGGAGHGAADAAFPAGQDHHQHFQELRLHERQGEFGHRLTGPALRLQERQRDAAHGRLLAKSVSILDVSQLPHDPSMHLCAALIKI